MTASNGPIPPGNQRSPHADPGRLASRLAALLGEHERLYIALNDLSERQSALIDEDDTDVLLGVLAERQRIVDRLLDAGEELRPLQGQWDGILGGVDHDTRERLREQVASIQDIAARVNERDDRDRTRLAARRKSLSEEIAGVNKSRGAVNAYGQQGGAGPRYQDRQG
ncbi:MAG: flagellar export chaperone FlgN [Phycisphaeraceae bacterium]|nr:flagellar export chaperone FlgN [Phycisphaeraceae bacterium]